MVRISKSFQSGDVINTSFYLYHLSKSIYPNNEFYQSPEHSQALMSRVLYSSEEKIGFIRDALTFQATSSHNIMPKILNKMDSEFFDLNSDEQIYLIKEMIKIKFNKFYKLPKNLSSMIDNLLKKWRKLMQNNKEKVSSLIFDENNYINIELIKFLREELGDSIFDVKDSSENTLLHKVIYWGNFDFLRDLVQMMPEVKFQKIVRFSSSKKKTVLQILAEKNDMRMLNLISEKVKWSPEERKKQLYYFFKKCSNKGEIDKDEFERITRNADFTGKDFISLEKTENPVLQAAICVNFAASSIDNYISISDARRTSVLNSQTNALSVKELKELDDQKVILKTAIVILNSMIDRIARDADSKAEFKQLVTEEMGEWTPFPGLNMAHTILNEILNSPLFEEDKNEYRAAWEKRLGKWGFRPSDFQ